MRLPGASEIPRLHLLTPYQAMALLSLLLGLLACSSPAVRASSVGHALEVDDSCTATAEASCALNAVQVLRSAGVAARSESATPSRAHAAPTITFFAVETREVPPLVLQVNDFTKRTGATVTVVGKGRKWEGYKTKVELQLEYLTELRERLGPEAAARELVVFMDGSDIFWGGCDLQTFQASYHEIATRQAAPIVFNAAVGLPPMYWDLPGSTPVDHVVEPQTPFPDLYAPYTAGCSLRCNGTWRNVCTNDLLSNLSDTAGHAVSPPKLRFINSGFFMGPVDKVADMMQWVLSNYEQYASTDQTVFQAYWLQQPGKATLDYRGELAVTLNMLGYMQSALQRHVAQRMHQRPAVEQEHCWPYCAPPEAAVHQLGFFMGPVDKVADMLQWVLSNYAQYNYGDQEFFQAFWLLQPGKATLDYRGELAVSLHNLGYNAFEADPASRTVRSLPLNRTMCFLHGASGGRYHLLSLLYQLDPSSLDDIDTANFCTTAPWPAVKSAIRNATAFMLLLYQLDPASLDDIDAANFCTTAPWPAVKSAIRNATAFMLAPPDGTFNNEPQLEADSMLYDDDCLSDGTSFHSPLTKSFQC
eukprot:CAMPEP_0195154844 /NCGR_PEP_ID=MMETSP0448-20130528/183859_1 /TAXON_ID=66468 /ORGANISM="Heterocapsa triquestra, Strain CCMP 448" /LENGTH=586 /DNA_ID=CAMNT_0040193625 /DNA_START=28 /DNA_END=1789 /DNA_ORIENTATION=+